MGIFDEYAGTGGRLFDNEYQDNFVREINQKGNTRRALTETDRRYDELGQAMRYDAYLTEKLKNEALSNPDGDLIWYPEKKSFIRKSTGNIYREGQYEQSVRAKHAEYDNIEKKWGLNRDDLERGGKLIERERRLARNPQDEGLQQEIGKLRSELGADKETIFRNWNAKQEKSGDRGFMANLGSWMTGRGWEQETRQEAAWRHVDSSRAVRNGLYQDKADRSYEDMIADGDFGVIDTIKEGFADPLKMAPFGHYLGFKSQVVQDAAIRMQSHRNPAGQDLYLLAARGDQAKAQEFMERDKRILESYKRENQERLLRDDSLRYKAASIVRDMVPYALELGIAEVGALALAGKGGAGLTSSLAAAEARGLTAGAKALGLVKNAGKFYKNAKLLAEPAAGLTINAPAALMMAAGTANETVTDQSVYEDQNGWHYDPSKLDGEAITRNSLIQAAAEIASEFSGGIIGKGLN